MAAGRSTPGGGPVPRVRQRFARDARGSSALTGAVLMFVAVGCFTTLDTILKYLSAQYPVLLLVWIRYFLQALYLAVLMPAMGKAALFRTTQWPIQAARGLLLSGASVMVVLSLQHLPMAQTYAVTFSTPLIATGLAVPLLGERASAAQWTAILLGFVGIVIALAPSPQMLRPALLFPVMMAASNAAYQVMTRLGGRRDGPLTLTFHAAAFGTLWTALALPFVFVPVAPEHVVILLAAGLFGTAAQILLAQAVRIAPMAVVSPIGYSQILWAIGIGYAVFGEVPSLSALAGGAIVAASGIAVIRLKGQETLLSE